MELIKLLYTIYVVFIAFGILRISGIAPNSFIFAKYSLSIFTFRSIMDLKSSISLLRAVTSLQI